MQCWDYKTNHYNLHVKDAAQKSSNFSTMIGFDFVEKNISLSKLLHSIDFYIGTVMHFTHKSQRTIFF